MNSRPGNTPQQAKQSRAGRRVQRGIPAIEPITAKVTEPVDKPLTCTLTTTLEKILTDLEERELVLSGCLCITKDNKLMYVMYDNKGDINFISPHSMEIVTLYEKYKDKNTMHKVTTISVTKGGK